jgi:hypothetical protein
MPHLSLKISQQKADHQSSDEVPEVHMEHAPSTELLRRQNFPVIESSHTIREDLLPQ